MTQRELSSAKEQYHAADDLLKRTLIKATHAGTVVGLGVHTEGGVIKPGQDIMHIVPKDDALIIEAKVNPMDIDVVHNGLTAKVQLTAYSGRNTPSLDGVVKHVSADVFQDERNGESYYEARIQINPEQLMKVKDLALYPGMPVQVMIITEKRTAFDYIITPFTRSFDRAFREK